jgi:tRNA (cmo5U34)-methyltransferase
MSDYDFTFAHRDEGFDNHIEKSIRGYNHLHDDVVNLSRYYVENWTNVVDIGCSTGKTIEAMAIQNENVARSATYVGVEVATGFKNDMENRFKVLQGRFPDTFFAFEFEDIRRYHFENCSLVTSLFTLQFMPPKDRECVIENIYNGLNEGGAFIFAEKTVADTGRFQDMFTFTYYDYKRKSFTEKDIMDKEVTLRNMLKPNTWSELTDMLYSAGFVNVQPFWRNYLFVGAIATK